jgi:hypothetical protein
MPCPHAFTDEHELPAVEAVLAGTLALMTGYSQALQAELHPVQRLHMGRKIDANLALLADHPCLSEPFQRVLLGLRARWQAMSDCTEAALPGGTRAAPAPTRLQ